MPPKEKLPDEVIEDFAHWVEMGAPDPRSRQGGQSAEQDRPGRGPQVLGLSTAQGFARSRRCSDTSWPRTDIDRFVLARLEKEGAQAGGRRRPRHADAPRDVRSDRAAADAGGDRRLLARQIGRGVWPRSSIGCWPRRASANAGAGTGSTWSATPNRPARSATFPIAMPGAIAITSSTPSTPTSRTIGSSSSNWPAICCPPKDAAEHDRLVIATGFLALGPKGVNVKKPEQFRMDQVDDQIDVTSRAFLGMTVACARCHDHKFDPIPTSRLLRAGRHLSQHADVFGHCAEHEDTPARTAADAGRHSGTDRSLARGRSKASTGAAARDRPGRSRDRRAAARAEARPQRPTKARAKKRNRAGRDAEDRAQGTPRGDQRAQDSSKNWKASRRRTRNLAMGVARCRDARQLPGARSRRVGEQGAGSPARRADRAQDSPTSHDSAATERPAGTGPLDCQRRQPAHGPRDGQSRLGALFGQGIVDTVDNFGRWATSRVIPNCSTRWPCSSWKTNGRSSG